MHKYEELLELVKRAQIDVGLLVVNAGHFMTGDLAEAKVEDIQALMDLNLYQPTAMLKKFIPILTARDKQSGLIIMSSLTSRASMPGIAISSSTKAYLSYLGAAVE